MKLFVVLNTRSLQITIRNEKDQIICPCTFEQLQNFNAAGKLFDGEQFLNNDDAELEEVSWKLTMYLGS